MNALILASLALAPSSQEADAKVTFAAPATRASILLPQLGAKLGMTLEASQQTRNEVLLVRVKDVGTKELLTRIAHAADAEWVKDGATYRLSRPAERQRASERAEVAERAKIYAALLGETATQLAKQPAWDAAQADQLASQAQAARQRMGQGGMLPTGRPPQGGAPRTGPMSPGERAVFALSQAIGPTALAQVGPEDRVVYALRPTRMQKQLPANSERIIRTYIDQQRQFAEAFQKRQKDDGRTIVISNGSGPEMGPGDPSLGIGQAVLVLRRFGNVLTPSLAVADTKGDGIASANWSMIPTEPPPSPKTDEPAIKLSPLAEELLKQWGPTSLAAGTRRIAFIRAEGSPTGSPAVAPASTQLVFEGGQEAAPPSVSAALRDHLLNPEEHEPHALVTGPALEEIAKITNENLVADLPDPALLTLSRRFATSPVFPSQILGSVGETAGLKVERSGGWMEVSPRFPASARMLRFDRPALGKALRALDRQGLLRLIDMAGLVNAQPKSVAPTDYEAIAMRLINTGGAQTAMPILSEPNALRIYSTLSARQQSALNNGEAITLVNLTAAQREWLSRDTFTSNSGPFVENGAATPFRIAGFNDSVSSERTQILPDGIVPNATLRLQVERQSMAMAYDSRSGASRLISANSYASSKLAAERTDMAMLGGGPQYDRFQPAEQLRYTLTFQLAPAVTLTRTLNDTTFDLQSTKVAFEGLPAGFRDEAEKLLAKMREAFGGIRVGGNSGGNIPPR